MQTAEGYYWVKVRTDDDWQVARWNGTDWFYCGVGEGYSEANAIVGPKIAPPPAFHQIWKV